MKNRNGDPLLLEGGIGEAIEVRVLNSIGIVSLVNFSMDGVGAPQDKTTPYNFTLAKECDLGLNFTFADQSGGSFTVRVTGSNGGKSDYAYQQLPGEANRIVVFTFFV